MLRARVSRSRLTPADEASEPPAHVPAKPARKATPRARALSADTLEGLGARKLAELLMDVAGGDPALARSLRLVLAGTDGGGRLAAEVEKRLRTIGRSRGFIGWDKARPLARELDSLRETIAGPLAAADSKAAVAQMRLLLSLAEGVLERSDDGSGALGEAFRKTGAELGRLCAPGRHEGEELVLSDLRIAASDAFGRKADAQALRWAAFERWLGATHLRAYLRELPGFDDVEAEDRAVAHALAHPDRNLALSFLVGWPNLEAANRLVRDHCAELDGRDYGRLRPAAERLAERHPAAATLLHRLLAEDVLQRASSRQYQYAARDIRSCEGLAPFLPDEAGLETHDAFMARLRREHPRKSRFWPLFDASGR